jgi:hypothetical protein
MRRQLLAQVIILASLILTLSLPAGVSAANCTLQVCQILKSFRSLSKVLT